MLKSRMESIRPRPQMFSLRYHTFIYRDKFPGWDTTFPCAWQGLPSGIFSRTMGERCIGGIDEKPGGTHAYSVSQLLSKRFWGRRYYERHCIFNFVSLIYWSMPSRYQIKKPRCAGCTESWIAWMGRLCTVPLYRVSFIVYHYCDGEAGSERKRWRVVSVKLYE